MAEYIYEAVEHIKEAPMKCFIAGVDQSCPHWHADIELLFLLNGTLEIVCDGKSSTMGTGDIVLFNSGSIHSDLSPLKDSVALIVQIQPMLLQTEYGKNMRFVFHLNTADSSLPQPPSIDSLRTILANLGLELFMKNDGFQFYIKSRLYELIGYLFRNIRYDVVRASAQDAKEADLERLGRMIDYIGGRYNREISLQKAALALNMSVSSLCRFFKDKMSMSFAEYVQSIRILHAKELLFQTRQNVLEISEECGFASLASFYRAFKRETGMTPSEYREKGLPLPGRSDYNVQGYSIVDPAYGYELLSAYLEKP